MGNAKKIIPHILDFLHPASVVDVGCGEGEWLREFQERGVRIQGLDAERYGQSEFWLSNSAFFQPVNMETVRITSKSKFDLAICLEVAHSYTEERAKDFVHDLCLLSDVVLFSAAIPGQEEDVVNGQMPSYWAGLFSQHGFIMLDCIRPHIWEDEGIDIKYRQNVFLHVREESLAKYPNLLKFFISRNKEQSLKDVVHPCYWKHILKKTETLSVSVKRKNRVAVVCELNVWKDLFDFIDTDEIDICAYFGNSEDVPSSMKRTIEGKFYDVNNFFSIIESLGAECFIFVAAGNRMLEFFLPKLHKLGITNNQVVILGVYLGQFCMEGISYYYQWNYLRTQKPNLDFIATGSSLVKLGLDLEAMQPYRGINLAANAQDLYYQYKIAELYFTECVDKVPKFALIFIGKTDFYRKVFDDLYYQKELLYSPIIKYEDMEYYGTTRGEFVEKILKHKYIDWLNKKISSIKNISFNDRDGEKFGNNLTKKWSEEMLSSKAKFLYVSRMANKEMVAKNTYILHKYINLLNEYDVRPICVCPPFAGALENLWPEDEAREYYNIIKHFEDEITFIDLSNMDLSKELFSDFVHLNLKGAKIVTEELRKEISKLNLFSN